MFLACSLTLDFASSIEEVVLAAAVERERTNVTAALLLCADTRSFEAQRDMVRWGMVVDESDGGRWWKGTEKNL